MRAIVMTAFGGPEVLRLTDIPEPEPEHGQIRVRLYAAGVNPAEAYIRTGQYAFFKPTLPYTPGFDGAGVVDKVGEGVQGSKPGDRVFVTALTARRNTGTYAEKVVCDAEAVHLLPDAVTLEQGAAVGFPGMTAYRALFQCAGLKPAERILIHGASGGVGTVAVQLARACGAFVIGTAGSPASMELVRSIGAHIVIRVDAKCIDELLLFQLPISFEHKIQKIVLNQFDMHELFSRPTFFVLNNNTNIHLLVPVDSS